jgi:hypothetical protein
MSNIFQFTPLTYHQTPDALIETGLYGVLTPSARALYALLCFKAQRLSSATARVTATDAALVGVAVNMVKSAREDLVEHKLVRATRGREGYLYELLDPLSGEALEQIQDLHAVDPEIVEEYFVDQLASFDAIESSYHHITSHCPFCEHKMRLMPFHVSCANGGGFTCHKCGVNGGVIDFEQLLAEKSGEELDRNRAYARARAGLLSAGRRVTKRRTAELAMARAMM